MCVRVTHWAPLVLRGERERAPGAELIHNLALLSKHVYCTVMWRRVYAAFSSLKLLLLQAWMLLQDCGSESLTSGSPSLTFHTHMNSFHLVFFLTLFPTSSPPPTPVHLWFLLRVASPLPFSLLIISWCWEDRGAVIKEPDWSVNSAQCCVECTRPSDGPNRASYCKQHAHLDSSRPQGEAGESTVEVSTDRERKFIREDVV